MAPKWAWHQKLQYFRAPPYFEGCVLNPLLYSLYTHDFGATFDSNTVVKFADDTAVLGLITHYNEKAYLKEVKGLTHWCQDNNFLLNISKTKELIVDFGKKQGRNYAPLNINGSSVERVDSFKYLGVHVWGAAYWLCGEEGKAETVSPQTLEEILDIPSDTEEFLLLHHRERPDGEHHCLVREQHQTGPQGPAKSGSFSWTHHRQHSTLHKRHLHQAV